MMYKFTNPITGIIIHCSDSDMKSHDNVATIRRWHLNRKMDDIAYHFLVRSSGETCKGRPINTVGAHCFGHNHQTLGICLSGKNIFSDIQLSSFAILCWELCLEYNLDIMTQVYPHSYFNRYKTCPNFNVKEVLRRFDFKNLH